MSQENLELVAVLRTELRAGFGLVISAIGETNSRIDQTNRRLEGLDQKFDQLGEKLDGIASYLLVSDRNADRLETRLFKLEGRVDKIERDNAD